MMFEGSHLKIGLLVSIKKVMEQLLPQFFDKFDKIWFAWAPWIIDVPYIHSIVWSEEMYAVGF